MSDNVISFPAQRPGRRRRRAEDLIPAGAPLDALIQSWTLNLEARNLSPLTVRSYTDTARSFCRYLADHGLPTDAERVDTEHVNRFLVYERERTSPASAAVQFRNLRVWFGWLAKERERTRPSPISSDQKPHVPHKAKEYLTGEEIRALLKACEGTDFEARRDTAIIRLFVDNGVRLSGMAGIRYSKDDEAENDLHLRRHVVRILLKGGDEIWAPFGRKAAAALDRYVRSRAKHPHAESPFLWLGVTGRRMDHMTSSGIRQMLKRRGEQAGVEHVHPHRFRGTFAHEYLAGGGTEGQAMRIAGWKSFEMLRHYTEDLAAERARQAHARLSPGDRI